MRTVCLVDVPPQRTAIEWSWGWWERGLFGLFGVAAAVGALWLTGMTLFMWGMSLACDRLPTWQIVGAAMLVGAACAIAVSVVWLAALSLLRVAVGRRGLRKRSWIAIPLVIAALSVTYLGVASAQKPSPSAPCQTFEMS